MAVGESKAMNDETVIYRDGCICLDPLIIGKTNIDTRDFHSGWGYAPSVIGSENADGALEEDVFPGKQTR